MRSNKKGQAAMEFLMTYGWAILIAIIAIAALIAFGVLKPGKGSANTCGTSGAITTNIGCTDIKVITDGAMTVIVTNGVGETLTGISMDACGATSNTIASLTDGAKDTLTSAGPCTCTNGRYKSDINVTLTQGSGMQHSYVVPVNVACEAA